MSDGYLMDADCIHGNTWWECPACDALMAADPALNHPSGDDCVHGEPWQECPDCPKQWPPAPTEQVEP